MKVRVLRSDRIKTKISSTIKSLPAIRFKKHWIKHVQIFVVLENEMGNSAKSSKNHRSTLLFVTFEERVITLCTEEKKKTRLS